MSVTTATSTSMSVATRRKHLAGKRTNSLGWAKSDCHTCSSLHRHCDRRRPRCSACLADDLVCGGYVQELNWERGSKRLGQARTKSIAKEVEKAEVEETPADPVPLPQPSSFTFVGHNDVTKRSRKKQTRKGSQSSLVSNNASPTDRPAAPRGSVSSWGSVSPTPPSASPSSSSWSLARASPAPSSTHDLPAIMLPLSAQIKRHPGDVEDALSFYHSFFSYITLTYHVQVNPWQAALPQIRDDIPCVRYAAVALAQRHQAHLRNRPEGLGVLNLKAQALSIFATHMNDLSFEAGIATSLLLIALDYAETGYSNWVIHLRGAFRILESNGGIRAAESRPNLRSQIAMLIWYDVNAALISRCGPIFPRRYLEALMMWQSESEWSILALNGLPDDMFLDMHDLAVAAAPTSGAEHRITTLERKISRAQVVSDPSNTALVAMSRAWKLGLLLYCRRVGPGSPRLEDDEEPDFAFEYGGDPEAPDDTEWVTGADAHALARQIIGTVADLPPDSNFQKQCLMPTVLAATELTVADARHRAIAVDFCQRWRQKTGIWIFDSGLEFMRTVWARNDAGERAESISGFGGDRVGDFDDADGDWRNRRSDACIAVPWTEMFPRGVEYGFLFG